MVIKISTNLFDNSDNLLQINYLLSIFSDKRRYIYFCEYKEIEGTELYSNLFAIQKDLIKENFSFVVQGSLMPDYVVDVNTSVDTFNIEEAIRFFIQPTTLILENSLKDAYFVDALIRNFKNRSKLIKRNKDNGWLSYGNGGGVNNIINFIIALMNPFDAFPKANHKYLKCFVLIDSDKEFTESETKPNHKKLFDFLNKFNIPYHELEKREMENYIPDDVLVSIPEIDEYLQAYLSLSPFQKDYFDLEKGFNNNIENLSIEIQNLYKGINDADGKVLRNGMNIPKYDKARFFKSEFPKLFENEKTTQESLKERTRHQIKDPDELNTILDKIKKIL